VNESFNGNTRRSAGGRVPSIYLHSGLLIYTQDSKAFLRQRWRNDNILIVDIYTSVNHSMRMDIHN